uniref:Phosphofructokinase domain-containing protein n=1 Tax=Cucumis melo TaxID=3656 RepID=A0A9I9CRT7_CUCME
TNSRKAPKSPSRKTILPFLYSVSIRYRTVQSGQFPIFLEFNTKFWSITLSLSLAPSVSLVIVLPLVTMSISFISNGEAAVKSNYPPLSGRVSSVYSEVQSSRINHNLPLPSVLRSSFTIVDGPPSSAAGNPDEIAKLFPNLFGQPSAKLVPSDSSKGQPDKKLKIGVVLSGGQAPGGHNVISGIFGNDYLQDHAKGSVLYGFRGGPAGIMKCKYIELTSEYIYPYRNQGGFDMICSGRDKIETPEQFKQAEETAKKLDLDGLVVIGGDDSNTNACLLAENFRGKNLKTRVIGCPKTIDGDLKCKEVPTSFGFDTACRIYAEMIGNVMIDARSTGKYYHLNCSCPAYGACCFTHHPRVCFADSSKYYYYWGRGTTTYRRAK